MTSITRTRTAGTVTGRKGPVGLGVPTRLPSQNAEKDNPYSLVTSDDLYEWQGGNEYIETGYRKASFSYLLSLSSIWRIHNETINIWSHLLGALAFATAVSFLSTACHTQHCYAGDIAAICVYFTSVVACFVASVSHHVFLDHSEHVAAFTSRLDLVGIVIPLVGTTVTSTYFGFHDRRNIQIIYAVLATVFGTLASVATFHPKLGGPTGRKVRAAMYSSLGLISFIPIIHGIITFGFAEYDRRMGLRYYIALGVCHSAGAALYAVRFPERFYPRRFDIWGSSHQLMHILVVLGSAFYTIGIVRAFIFWRGRT